MKSVQFPIRELLKDPKLVKLMSHPVEEDELAKYTEALQEKQKEEIENRDGL